jgi:hypothetical protein
MRIFDPERDIQGAFLGAVTEAVRTSLVEDGERHAPDWLKAAEQGGSIGWVDLVHQSAAASAPWLDDPAKDDIAYQGLLSCYANGVPGAPAWKVYVASYEMSVSRPVSQDVSVAGLEHRVTALHGADRQLARILLQMRHEFTTSQNDELAEKMHEAVLAANIPFGFEGRRFRALTNGSDASVDAAWEGAASPWPEWLPLPLWSCGTVRVPPARVWSESVAAADLARRSVDILLAERPAGAQHALFMADAAELALDEDFSAGVADVEARALSLLTAVLPDGPALRLDMRHPESWLRGEGPQWLAHDRELDRWIALDELSAAQRRWAGLAIDLALSERQTRTGGAALPLVALADEPEGGLHRRVESRLALGLSELGRDLNAAMVVATHSPSLLRERHATLHHVARSELTGKSVLAPVTLDMPARLALSETAERLGLDVVDLLQVLRTALVVEGEHDDVILRHLLADTLQETDCWILPLRGASNAPSLSDAQLLFDATTAHVLVLLDNLENRTVQHRWREAQAALATGSIDRARHAVMGLASGKGAEGAWLSELGLRAIARGSLARIHAWGLSKPDIVMYLPVEDFVATGESWESLHTTYKGWRSQAGSRPARGVSQDFKSWLRQARQAQVSTASIRSSALRLSEVPKEIAALGERLKALASGSQPS